MKNKLNFEDVINPNEFGGLLYDKKEKNAINRILLKEKIFRYATGEETECDLLEKNICRITNSEYALAVNSGTSGLKVALKSLGVKPNDKVLVSSYTFLSSATSVLNIGAIPIPMDFSINTGIDLMDLEEQLKIGAKAIILVHLQGRTFDVSKVLKLAEKYHTYVIEDACQAFASKYDNKYAGTFADIGIYSFQQNKQITSGEGGMIIFKDKKHYEIARNFHDMGSVRVEYPSWEEDGALIGDNYRMTNLQAAILNIQLSKLNKMIKKQKKLYEIITKGIKNNLIIQPLDKNGFTGQNILFIVNDFSYVDKIIDLGKKYNIEVRKIWNKPYDQRKVFKKLNLDDVSLKNKHNLNSNMVSDKMMSITISPIISKKEALIMRRFFKQIEGEYLK